MVSILLAIELLDELVFGAREAAWPLIRNDLGLTYAGIGLLITLPNLVGSAVEPAFGLLGDSGRRRRVVLGGGVCFAAGLCLAAAASGFGALLAAFILLAPASGAFVSLSQATLMDLDPSAHEHNMARWVLAGSAGIVIGPLALAGARAAGCGWRGLMLAFAEITVPLVVSARAVPFREDGERTKLAHAVRRARRSLRNWRTVRWLVILELSDLMGDVFFGFLALYMVGVAGLGPVRAGLAVAVWTAAALVGNALLLPVLRRVSGVRYLRSSAAAVAILFPIFLLVPGAEAKMTLLVPLGLLNAGRYAIPKAGLYTEMPGQSGTAVALANLAGVIGGLFPLAIGILAQRVGLQSAMWTLMLAPMALLLGLPRTARARKPTELDRP